GCRSATSRKPPRTPTRARRCAMTVPAAVSTGMPPTSSPPTLPEPPGKHLTAHMQAPPDRTEALGGARQCRQQEPRLVTDRDPKRDHEPPFGAPYSVGWPGVHNAREWPICVVWGTVVPPGAKTAWQRSRALAPAQFDGYVGGLAKCAAHGAV